MKWLAREPMGVAPAMAADRAIVFSQAARRDARSNIVSEYREKLKVVL
jgi:hypothetical protein